MKQSVYQQIKNCSDINEEMKETALKELRAIQRSSILRKRTAYKVKYVRNILGGLMLWSQTPSGYDFWDTIDLMLYKNRH